MRTVNDIHIAEELVRRAAWLKLAIIWEEVCVTHAIGCANEVDVGVNCVDKL